LTIKIPLTFSSYYSACLNNHQKYSVAVPKALFEVDFDQAVDDFVAFEMLRNLDFQVVFQL
jgi:hypothetical protein